MGDLIGITYMLVRGVLELAFHPVKTYDLVVRGKGWYDDELDRRELASRGR